MKVYTYLQKGYVKKTLLVFIIILWMPHIYAIEPSRIGLFKPYNQSVSQDTVGFFLQWYQVTDNSGDKVLYDLYFGKDLNPQLFRSDIDPSTDGVYPGKSNEYVFEQTLTDNGITTSGVGILYCNYSADTLENNTTYYWKVVAKKESGESVASEIYSYTTIRTNTCPTSPSLISPTDGITIMPQTPTLTWTKSTDSDGDAISYEITCRKDGELYSTIATTNDTSYTFAEPLIENTTYYWNVSVVEEYSGITNSSIEVYSFTIGHTINDAPVTDKLVSPTNNILIK